MPSIFATTEDCTKVISACAQISTILGHANLSARYSAIVSELNYRELLLLLRAKHDTWNQLSGALCLQCATEPFFETSDFVPPVTPFRRQNRAYFDRRLARLRTSCNSPPHLERLSVLEC